MIHNELSNTLGKDRTRQKGFKLCGGVIDPTRSLEDPTDEEGDIGIGDSVGFSVSLGGGISLGENKSRESKRLVEKVFSVCLKLGNSPGKVKEKAFFNSKVGVVGREQEEDITLLTKPQAVKYLKFILDNCISSHTIPGNCLSSTEETFLG
ncbi:hypothetical protein Tco_1173030 [Tanacetum coccineum]